MPLTPQASEQSLLPRPVQPGLYVAVGDARLIPWALRALAGRFTPQARIVWIDAANQFNAHWIAHSGRVFRKDSKEVLRAFQYARPFTAFQLEAMVNQKLLPAVIQAQALFAVIADPLILYEAAEAQKYSIDHSFNMFTEGLQVLSKRLAILLLMPTTKPAAYHQRLLQMADHVVSR